MSDPVLQPAPDKGWRESRWLIVLELAIVAAIYLADRFRWHHLIVFSKIPYLLVVGWLSLRLRGLRWKNIGLRIYRSWGRTLALGILFGVLMEALELFVTQPLLERWLHDFPDLTDFNAMVGNFKLLLTYVALAWVLAAFGEEMVWRGYLMNRVADLFGDARAVWIFSLIVTSVAFGFGHFDQGMTGRIENTINGLLLGSLYLIFGRSLAVPIVAHGITDTVDLIIIYLGKYPGMH
jgi:membrane protease YdiL (CAAX protease family)